MNVVQIAIFILLFGALVFLHELGHFLVARLFKIEVEEFGFGFPPRMVTLGKVGGTLITLNWIPFGGFVRPKGEVDAGEEGGLAAANPWVRLSVAVAGPVMNLIVGIVLFSFMFYQAGSPDYSKIVIRNVSDGTAAQSAGLQPGDIFVKVDGQPIDSADKLVSIVQANLNKQITITVQRNGKQVETTAVPNPNPKEGEGSLGVGLGPYFAPIPFTQAVPAAVQTTFDQAKALVTLPAQLIRGTIPPEQARLVGPVGIYDMFSQARQMDQQTASLPQSEQPIPPINTLGLMATLSVALGFTNLLPLPALDGGRILFTLPEILIGKRIPQRYENIVHLIGFATLLLLMIYITTQDIIHPITLP